MFDRFTCICEWNGAGACLGLVFALIVAIMEVLAVRVHFTDKICYLVRN